jgi:hypothetical protein
MTRTPAFVAAMWLMAAATAGAATMKSSAPDRMASPAEKQKMQICRNQAAAQNVPMAERSKFVMNCMAKTK